MMRKGLLEEAREFNDNHVADISSRSQQGIFQSMGYKEFDPYFLCEQDASFTEEQKREVLQESLDRLLTRHVQYTKKQLQWIRNRLLPRNAPVVYFDTSNLGKPLSSW